MTLFDRQPDPRPITVHVTTDDDGGRTYVVDEYPDITAFSTHVICEGEGITYLADRRWIVLDVADRSGHRAVYAVVSEFWDGTIFFCQRVAIAKEEMIDAMLRKVPV